MIGSRASADVGDALAGLARASRSLAGGAPVEQTLAELAEAAAQGTGAEVAVLWLPETGGSLAARSVWSASAGLAAEVEGLRVESLDRAAALVRSRLDDGAELLTVPFDAAEGGGTLALARRGVPFELDDTRLATVAAELAALATRLAGDLASASGAAGMLAVAGDALAAVADDDGAPSRVARLAAVAAGGEAALVWRLRDDGLEVAGAYGPIVADETLQRAAGAIIDETGMLGVDGDASSQVVTLRLGQPALGALQVRFAPGRAPDERGREQLAGFAVRAAHALRSSERARDATLELERSRALLSVIGEAISQLSLSHTLETAIERVAYLLGVDRVAVYLTEQDGIAVAAARGIEGPHEAVAGALLAAALRSRHGGVIVEIGDARSDERLARVRAHVEESGVRSALALGLVVGDEPIGILVVYPRQRRTLSASERALLTALAAQLAVAVQNARLHERVYPLVQPRVLYGDGQLRRERCQERPLARAQRPPLPRIDDEDPDRLVADDESERERRADSRLFDVRTDARETLVAPSVADLDDDAAVPRAQGSRQQCAGHRLVRPLDSPGRGHRDPVLLGQVDRDAVDTEEVGDPLDRRLESVRERELRDRLADHREERAAALELERGVARTLGRAQRVRRAHGEPGELFPPALVRRSAGRKPHLERPEGRLPEPQRHHLGRRVAVDSEHAGLVDDRARGPLERLVGHDRAVGAGDLEPVVAESPDERGLTAGSYGRQPGHA
ncbi:MAG: GAF domain-containing protein [Gaiellaceae bacterium]